ncbi:hypothetical protein [Legionella brunensis]|uniref:Uncharacterized protein n=1 Tax=Legionella brunensis TaxID=29422 RepID=A0A0W0SU09_9GAMM|nr:hypothetical protein [Legionella brunensis]KTC86729.1 hypothetical protein Lbru_0670 [Legionella brunensis]
MPQFFKKKLIHPVDVSPIVQPVQDYIVEEKAVVIKELEKIKQKLHNLTVEMTNEELVSESQKDPKNTKNSDKNRHDQQFNEILELMREFSVTLKTYNDVVVKRVNKVCEDLPAKIGYIRSHHTIEALRSVHDFLTESQMHINNAARLLLVDNAKEIVRLQEVEHSSSSCIII